MYAVVTGAAGFIGSALAERLVSEGHRVVGVDCFTGYYSREQKEQNLAGLRTSDRFELRTTHLSYGDLSGLLDGVEVVFHQAGQPGVRHSKSAGFDDLAHNVQATQRVLERRLLRTCGDSSICTPPIRAFPPLRSGTSRLSGRGSRPDMAINRMIGAALMKLRSVFTVTESRSGT